MLRRSVAAIALCAAGLCFFNAACGYRLSGSGDLPGNVETMAIGAFENRTGESGIEATITNNIIFEFTRRGKVTLTEKASADAVLTGVIRSAVSQTVSRRSRNTTAERRITITVDVRMVRPSGELLWTGKGISEYEAYAVTSDKIRTEQNKKSAVANLSRQMAQRIYYQIISGF